MDNRFLRLPFHFDPERLRQDLDTCVSLSWQQHYNRADYEGSWTSIALRSGSGLSGDIFAHSSNEDWQDTPLLAQCPYFQEIIDGLHCDKETIRLLALAPGSRIKEHTDHGLGYPYGFFRLHIPITTDAGVIFRVDGCDLSMQAGECWYADFSLPHSVAHEGSTTRVHLVIDGLRNEWSDALFQSAGYDFTTEKRPHQLDRAAMVQMIAHLESMGTATAQAIAAEVRSKLQA